MHLQLTALTTTGDEIAFDTAQTPEEAIIKAHHYLAEHQEAASVRTTLAGDAGDTEHDLFIASIRLTGLIPQGQIWRDLSFAEDSGPGFLALCEKTPEGNLKIVLTPQGRHELNPYVDEWTVARSGDNDPLARLLERELGNGWEFLRPEDLGALTEAPILSDEIDHDDDGTITKSGRVYWYPDYMIKDPVEEMQLVGYVIFSGETAD